MADDEPVEKAILISEDDARGALSPDEVSSGDTLLPMLFWAIGLTTVGIIIAVIVIYLRGH